MKIKDNAAILEALISKIISDKEKQIAFVQTKIIQASVEGQLLIPKIKQ